MDTKTVVICASIDLGVVVFLNCLYKVVMDSLIWLSLCVDCWLKVLMML